MVPLTCRGVPLTLEQFEACIEPLNSLMHNLIPRKEFEEKCIAAMAAAGCPLDESLAMEEADAKKPAGS